MEPCDNRVAGMPESPTSPSSWCHSIAEEDGAMLRMMAEADQRVDNDRDDQNNRR